MNFCAEIDKTIEFMDLPIYDLESQNDLIEVDNLMKLRMKITSSRKLVEIKTVPKDKRLRDKLFFCPDFQFRRMAGTDKRILVQKIITSFFQLRFS
jgi:hypothetical protein